MDQVSSSKSQRSSLSHSDSAPPTLKRNMQPCLSKEGNLDDTTGRRWGFCCRFATIHPVAPTWRQNMHQALWDCPSLHIPTEEPFWHLSWCLKTLFKSLYLPSQIFWHPDSTIDDWHEKHVTNYYHQLSWLWLTSQSHPYLEVAGGIQSWGVCTFCVLLSDVQPRQDPGQGKPKRNNEWLILFYSTLLCESIYLYIYMQTEPTNSQSEVSCEAQKSALTFKADDLNRARIELNPAPFNRHVASKVQTQ